MTVIQFERKLTLDDLVDQKLVDAMTPGFVVPMSHQEAEIAGAFEETALSLEDALESCADIDSD